MPQPAHKRRRGRMAFDSSPAVGRRIASDCSPRWCDSACQRFFFHSLPFHGTQVHLIESCVGPCSPSTSRLAAHARHPLPPSSSPLFHSSIHSKKKKKDVLCFAHGALQARRNQVSAGRFADWAEIINQHPGSPLPQPWPQPLPDLPLGVTNGRRGQGQEY